MTLSTSDGGGLALTDYFYTDWNALEQLVEPDGDVVENSFGTSGNEAARVYEVKRGGTPQQRFEYTRDGAVAAIYNVPLSTSVAAGRYTFDPLRRLVQEERETAGQVVQTAYYDETRPAEVVVLDLAGSTTFVASEHTYDGLGRPLTITAGGTTVRRWQWDSKGSYAGTYLVDGIGITLTNANQLGRLAWEQGDSWVTFYEYDALGRTTAVIHHDGPLSAFAAAKLTQITLAYNSTATQELVSVTYPSGRVVTYAYGADKELPTSVIDSALGTIVSHVEYEPYRAPKSWRWLGDATKLHETTRDLLARTTEIEESFGGVPVSRVIYSLYDGDGDVGLEEDVSPEKTWLTRLPLGNQSRSYAYEPASDRLEGWVDDGVQENVTYAADGRRLFEDNSEGFSYEYNYDPLMPERLLSKVAPTGVSANEVFLEYDDAGRVVAIERVGDDVGHVTLAYGPLGNVASTALAGVGTFENRYDAQMRRVRRIEPGGTTRTWRYAFDRAPLEERLLITEPAPGLATDFRYETIYLGSEPILQVASRKIVGQGLPLTQGFLLFNDRMGVTRKTARFDGAVTHRVVMDAWGGSGAANGDVVADPVIPPIAIDPSLGWRFPGQYADAGELSDNGWRAYVPDVGQYTSAEPLHNETAGAGGPQIYSYAAGQPLVLVDPDAQLALPIGIAVGAGIAIVIAASATPTICANDPSACSQAAAELEGAYREFFERKTKIGSTASFFHGRGPCETDFWSAVLKCQTEAPKNCAHEFELLRTLPPIQSNSAARMGAHMAIANERLGCLESAHLSYLWCKAKRAFGF